MTNEQFDALMNAIDALIDAKMALNLKWDLSLNYLKYGFTAEQTARELLVTDSPTEDQPQ